MGGKPLEQEAEESTAEAGARRQRLKVKVLDKTVELQNVNLIRIFA